MTDSRWVVWACPTCGRQMDNMDGGHCHDHEPSTSFEEYMVVRAGPTVSALTKMVDALAADLQQLVGVPIPEPWRSHLHGLHVGIRAARDDHQATVGALDDESRSGRHDTH